MPDGLAQDYEVADIDCYYGTDSHEGERLSARLRKPEGFRGYPTFADDRRVDPQVDGQCQIRPDPSDPTGLIYNLLITDLKRCGVLKRNGFINVRIWFPQLPGIVMMSDQEVIIMCKPPQATVVENRAAGFAGSIPNTGRISGIVEESPGKLEYVVSLYRESASRSGDFGVPVEEAIPIGTRLQLRATINTNSAWKYAKLVDVTVSNSADDPLAVGHITLVQNGCRVQEMASIVPKQPYRAPHNPGEVMVDFEAFLLNSADYQSRLWIHSKIKACMNAVDCLAAYRLKENLGEVRLEFEAFLLEEAKERKLWVHTKLKACVDAVDCLPEFCLDLFQPSGHGRRRRKRSAPLPPPELRNHKLGNRSRTHEPITLEQLLARPEVLGLRNASTASTSAPTGQRRLRGPSTDFGEGIGVTVLLPAEEYAKSHWAPLGTCSTYLIVSGILGVLLLTSAVIMCCLAQRLSRLRLKQERASLEKVIHVHRRQYASSRSRSERS
ncbi:unnamed protein product [Darwinula stevensoni]|uniref:ZP domain-containing protein n=1 Tax=Darwinula stevensoni TaxID=69355 RepID=A0A7R8X3W8_9CRUS|nr:unnamed protein product [Darwinula stevensoni]CAG0885433.1 unnamed protein product [Darwinula stevensoni]